MNNGSPIRLVFFDLGGVVLRICRSWAEGCAAAGIDLREEARRRLSREQRDEIVHRYQRGLIGCDEFARQISDAQGGLYSPDEIRAVHDAWILGEYDGVAGMIDRLHAAGLDTASLSNTNHAHWRQVAAYPAVMRLRHLLASHLLGLHKPDPAIYLTAQRLLGVRHDQVVFFDDLEENIAAARQAGWHAHRIDPLAPTPPQIEAALRTHGAL